MWDGIGDKNPLLVITPSMIKIMKTAMSSSDQKGMILGGGRELMITKALRRTPRYAQGLP